MTRRNFIAETGAGITAGSALALAGCNNAVSKSADRTEAAPASTSPSYRLVRAEGTHRELGRQHGEQAVEQIRAHVDYIARTQKLTRQTLHAKALQFRRLFDRYCPHLLDEIHGLAEGAGISLAEALAVNIRGELGKVTDVGCSTYVIGGKNTASGDILVGQNSDMTQPNIEMGYVLHLKPRGKPQILIWTFGGMIGYHGMNSAGVAHFANALGGGPAGQFGLPHYPVKRLMLERSTVQEVVEVLEEVPLASNGNYVLCGGEGAIIDVEATTAGPKVLRDEGAGFLAHTNHFLCPAYATRENHEKSLPDSFARLERINQLIEAEKGSVSVDALQRILSDHANFPTSICRHPKAEDPNESFETAGRTVASMIAEPASLRMHVALGNPCHNPFVTYSMDA